MEVFVEDEDEEQQPTQIVDMDDEEQQPVQTVDDEEQEEEDESRISMLISLTSIVYR